MVIISPECRTFLKKHIPDYRRYLVIEDLLWAVDQFIIHKCAPDGVKLNEIGERAQKIYDELEFLNRKNKSGKPMIPYDVYINW